MLFELAFGQSGGEVRTVNRHIELLENVRQRAEVILMSVRKHYRGDVVAILFKKIKVRNADVNAIGRFFRKAHARVENEHLILITHSHAIHSKLADTAERNYL